MKRKKLKKRPLTKRERTRWPGLDKAVNLRTRQDLIDYDYIDKLSDVEKDWLSKFTEEFVSGTFKKGTPGKKGSGPLHKTKKLKRDCYNRNNLRNRCVYTKSKACGQLTEYLAWAKTKEQD
jgi:hypothetical protein